jgi:hypothetical protein
MFPGFARVGGVITLVVQMKEDDFIKKLKEHQRRAAMEPLNILVWGPAKGDDIEHTKRREIRDVLGEDGHHVYFSEDLILATKITNNPSDDELLQVDSAHLVVVLYGSRGVQSEIEDLLRYPRLAEKAILFLHEKTLGKVLASYSGEFWKKLRRRAEVITYNTAQFNACKVVGRARALAQDIRRAVYVAKIRRKLDVE